MNFKEWVLPLSFAIVMTYAVQYFLEPRLDSTASQSVKSGSGFTAPTMEAINKPLNLTVQHRHEKEETEELHTVTTKCGSYVFSNKGAVLQSFSFPWQHGSE